MSLISLSSIAILLATVVWACVLLTRTRDWRLGVFAGAVALLVLSEILELLASRPSSSIILSLDASEAAHLVLSLVLVLTVLGWGQLVRKGAEATESLRLSENKYRTLFASASDAFITTVAPAGIIVDSNQAAAQMLGYSAEELPKIMARDLIAPEAIDGTMMELKTQVDAKGSFLVETLLVRKDGSRVPAQVGGRPVPLMGESMFQVIARDITEQKRAEERIQHLTTVLKAVRNVNHLITKEKNRGRLIQAACQLLSEGRGYERALILLVDDKGKPGAVADAGIGEAAAGFVKQIKSGFFPGCIKATLAGKEPFSSYRKEKELCSGCYLARENHDLGVFVCRLEHEGRVYGVIAATVPPEVMSNQEERGLFREVSDDIAFALADIEREEQRRRAEEELVKLRLAVTTSGEVIFLTDCDGTVLFINPEFTRVYGYTAAEVVGKSTPRVLKSGRAGPEGYAMLWQALLNRQVVKGEFVNKTKDGRFVDVEGSSSPVLDDSGNIVGFLAIQRDVTERKKVERALQDSEEKLRLMLESVTDGIAVFDLDGKITEANQAFVGMVGFDRKGEMISRNIVETIAGEDRKRLRADISRIFKRGNVQNVEYQVSRRDGGTFPAELSMATLKDTSARPIGFIAVVEDITERKKMQQHLMVTDRLASIGELASGIAHEINNPLTGILGLSELLLTADVSAETKTDLETIHSEAQRTARIVQGLLTFARKQPKEKYPVDINESIAKVLQLRAYEQKVSNISVVTRFAPDLPRVMGNSFQLQQVFINIIINAEYFMIEARGRGNLTISTEQADNFVRASFADNGPGIKKEVMQHLFTPFFTTKEVGKGTGLGLSICHGIITEHGGKIYADSEAGKGATFTIELPVLDTKNGGLQS